MMQSAKSVHRLMPVLLVVIGVTGCSKQVTSSTEDMAMVIRQASVGQLDMAGPRMADAGASTSGEVRVTDQAIATTSASSASSQVMEQSGSASAASSQMGDQFGSSLGDVFFDYDKFSLPADGQSVLNLDARLLESKQDIVMISGHCDERGSSAYNLVLGEKRARSVKQYLEDLGVAPSRMRVVSYGKEKPFCQDHNSECWRNNRRAHLALR